MATVPYTPYPQRIPEGGSVGGIPGQDINSSVVSFGGRQAQTLEQSGQQMKQAGSDLGDIALQRQELLNQTATDEGFNKLQESFYALQFGDPNDPSKPGYYGLQGKAAVDAYPDVVKALGSTRQQILGAMPNDRAKLEFDVASRRLLQYTMGDIGRHHAQQVNAYATDTQAASEDLALRNIATLYDNDRAYADNLAEMDRSATRRVELAGGDDLMLQDAMLKNRAKAVQARTLAMAEVDPVAANIFLKKNMGLIPAEAYATLANRLTTDVDVASAQTAVARAWPGSVDTGTPMVDQGQGIPDATWPAQIGQESGGQQFDKNGKPLTSSAGAVGYSQIMPSTARLMAAKLGLPYDEKKLGTDKDYNEQLGYAYKQEMLKRYDGSQVLALAAYNAGPGKVDEWLAQNGDPRSGQISNAAWIAKIPVDETRNYVSGILSRTPIRDGSEAPTTGIPNLDGVLKRIDQDPNLTPSQRERAYSLTLSRFHALVTARNESRQEQAYQETLANHNLTKIEDETSKQGWDLSFSGKLTLDWLHAHRNDLNQSDYTALGKAATGEGPQRDDPDALVALNEQVGSATPAEFRSLAAQYMKNNRIKTTTYQSLVDRNVTLSKDDQPLSPFKSAREFVSQGLDPGLLSGPGESMLRAGRANALAEFDNWALEHPQASRQDYMQMGQTILHRYQTVNYDQISLSLGLPMFYSGQRSDIKLPDIDAAEGKAMQEFDAGRLSKTQLTDELRRIANWREVLKVKPPSGAAPKPPTGAPVNPANPGGQ